MDWIERLFGISLDHGSGTLELMIAAVVAVTVVSVVVNKRAGIGWVGAAGENVEWIA